MDFSREKLAGKYKVRYDSRSGCFVGNPNIFVFLQFYYQEKWRRAQRMYKPMKDNRKKN